MPKNPNLSLQSYSPATLSSVSLLPSSEYLAKSKESRVLMLPALSVMKRKIEELNRFLFNYQNKVMAINYLQ